MCRICDCRYNPREKAAAHDFVDQMRDYYGFPIKHLKNRNKKNLKKSIVNQIENQLCRINNEYYTLQLKNLLNNVEPVSTKKEFEKIMVSYYKSELNLR